MDLIKEYRNLKERLEKWEVELIAEKTAQPQVVDELVMECVIEEIEYDSGVVLKEEEIKYVSFFESSICWNYEGEDFIYGGFKLSGLWDALARESKFWKEDFSLGPDVEVPEELKHFEKLGWFEKQAWCDGCFIQEKGVFPPKIAFFDKTGIP